jgi:hypothetical protein
MGRSGEVIERLTSSAAVLKTTGAATKWLGDQQSSAAPAGWLSVRQVNLSGRQRSVDPDMRVYLVDPGGAAVRVYYYAERVVGQVDDSGPEATVDFVYLVALQQRDLVYGE